MKKFLSLVLAMIMTMSLVTISAGATEYKDLTDKSEIQYEEAVAVLNRIGVITGYEDGTFRPETELTRGAAAKIIVSLMIGPEAAAALPNNTSPYPDVPAGHTFAGVISYCKTAEYISGYNDGTFKPAGTLTGYAFAKMLLGALGYKSDIEGFSGYGWTNNVAKVGNVAGLFERISFDGAAAVNRDQACQLALNTLKATMVTYGGTTIINGGTAGQMTMQGTTATPRTSNNRDINANIGRKDWYGGNNQGSDYLTLEFGEEHFQDLRLEHDRYDPAHDQFGRPSNEWSYKKVTIGTFPLKADFTYTTQVAHVEESDSNKEKALGLRNYDLVADGGYSYWTGSSNWWDSNKNPSSYIQNDGFTNLWLNGLEKGDFFKTKEADKYKYKVADIADFTDNGTLVEVYVSYVDADWITDVVVIQTQLMEVDKVASDYVSLKRQEPDVEKGNPDGEPRVGYNQAAIDVDIENVKDNNEECYATLKDLKAGDDIAVVPVTTDNGKTYEAAEVYVPETVSGAWTRVDTYGKLVDKKSVKSAISITVGGTEYKIADWNDKMYDQDDTHIKATRKDVTLIMDKYGNAMKAKGIGDTSGFMVIGNYYQSIVNNKVCTFVHGWDISGTELNLNLGSNVKFQQHNATIGYGHELGELVTYTSEGTTGDADYALTHDDVDSVFPYLHNGEVVHVNGKGEIDQNADTTLNGATPNFEAKTNNLRLPVSNSAATSYTGHTPKSAWPSENKNNEAPRDAAHFSNSIVILNDIEDKLNGTTTTSDADFYTRYTYSDKVKFIYVNYTEGEDEVDSVEFKTGRQNASFSELTSKLPGGNFIYSAQASIDGDKITSVVIKKESSDASLNRMLYVINYTGFNEYDRETGKTGIGVLAARFNADGSFVDEVEMVVDKKIAIGAFASYSDMGEATINGKTIDHHYHIKPFTRHNTNPAVLFSDSVNAVRLIDPVEVKPGEDWNLTGKWSKYLLQLNLDETYCINGDGVPTGNKLAGDAGDDGTGADEKTESYVLSNWRTHDIIDNKWQSGHGIIWANSAHIINASDIDALDKIDDVEDMLDWMAGADKDLGTSDDRTFEVTILFNESPSSDDFRVSYLIVLNDEKAAIGSGITWLDADSKLTSIKRGDKTLTQKTEIAVGDILEIKVAAGYVVDALDHLKPLGNDKYEVTATPASFKVVKQGATKPASAEVNTVGKVEQGKPAQFKASAKDSNGVTIPSAQLEYNWGIVAGSSFYTFAAISEMTPEQKAVIAEQVFPGDAEAATKLDTLLTAVDATKDQATLEVDDGAKLDGVIINCAVAAKGSDDDTTSEPTLPSAPIVNDEVPEATEFTATFNIAKGAKVTVSAPKDVSKEGNTADATLEVGVENDQALTFKVGAASSNKAPCKVTVKIDGVVKTADESGNYTAYVRANTVVDVEVEYLKPTAEQLTTIVNSMSAATLNDTSTPSAGPLYAAGSYTVTEKKATADGMSIKISATDLVSHKNGQGNVGHWVGYFINGLIEGKWTLNGYQKPGSSEWKDWENWTGNGDGFYFDGVKNSTYKMTLRFKNLDAEAANVNPTGTVEVPLTIDCSGVKAKAVKIASAGFAIAEEAGATLHDTSNKVEDGALYTADSYKVKTEVVGTGDITGAAGDPTLKTTVSVAALKEHQNGGSPEKVGYWIGFKLLYMVDGATLTKFNNTDITESNTDGTTSGGVKYVNAYMDIGENGGKLPLTGTLTYVKENVEFVVNYQVVAGTVSTAPATIETPTP